MVLLPKQWKSRSSPGFAGGVKQDPFTMLQSRCRHAERRLFRLGAGWSSPVARQAHNLKVAGSNPAPATNKKPAFERAFLLSAYWAGGCGCAAFHSIAASTRRSTDGWL